MFDVIVLLSGVGPVLEQAGFSWMYEWIDTIGAAYQVYRNGIIAYRLITTYSPSGQDFSSTNFRSCQQILMDCQGQRWPMQIDVMVSAYLLQPGRTRRIPVIEEHRGISKPLELGKSTHMTQLTSQKPPPGYCRRVSVSG